MSVRCQSDVTPGIQDYVTRHKLRHHCHRDSITTTIHYVLRYHDKVIIEEELNLVRSEQQDEWEMAKHNLKMAKKTLSQESLSRSDYTISTMINSTSNGFSDPGGVDAKRRLSRNLLSADRKELRRLS